MDNMRWILLLIGVLLVAGIYIAGRLQSRERNPRRSRRAVGRLRRKAEPDLAGDMLDEFTVDELESMDHLLAEDAAAQQQDDLTDMRHKAAKTAVPDKVFSVFVTAPTSVPFRGPMLLGALAAAKLEFGDMQIFHRIELVDGREKVLFSAANIREPGTFDLSAMQDFTSEGLALFMQVPCAVDASRAFDAMIESARILADNLDGHVCDARRSALTQQTIRHMREEVINCQLQQRVAQTAS
ncbi:MAG: cell division protein ZipA [Gammaproteobacteria bacterium]